MPSPHSYDLRKRAMAHFEKYGSSTLTSKTFNISRSILYDWKKRKEETGDIRAKEGYQNGYGHKIVDLKKFQQQVENEPGLTLSGIVRKSGIKMSEMTCSRALKKINITRKKRPLGIKSKVKKSGKHS
jgi:transposase